MANWKPLLPGVRGTAGWEDAPFPEARLDLNSFQVPRLSGWISAQLLHLTHSLAGPQLGAVSTLPTGVRGSLWLSPPFPRPSWAGSQKNNLWKKQRPNINYFLTNLRLSDHPGCLLSEEILRVKTFQEEIASLLFGGAARGRV